MISDTKKTMDFDEFSPENTKKWIVRQEAEARLEYELESLLKRCVDELGLEWTTDIVEVSLNRKVLRNGTNT